MWPLWLANEENVLIENVWNGQNYLIFTEVGNVSSK